MKSSKSSLESSNSMASKLTIMRGRLRLCKTRLGSIFLIVLGIACVLCVMNWVGTSVLKRSHSTEYEGGGRRLAALPGGEELIGRGHGHRRRKHPHAEEEETELQVCQVPKLSLETDTNRDAYHSMDPLQCHADRLFTLHDGILRLNHTVLGKRKLARCEYRAIDRISDQFHTYSHAVVRKDNFEIKINNDFFRVECYTEETLENQKKMIEEQEKMMEDQRLEDEQVMNNYQQRRRLLMYNNGNPAQGFEDEAKQKLENNQNVNNVEQKPVRRHSPQLYGTMGLPDFPMVDNRGAIPSNNIGVPQGNLNPVNLNGIKGALEARAMANSQQQNGLQQNVPVQQNFPQQNIGVPQQNNGAQYNIVPQVPQQSIGAQQQYQQQNNQQQNLMPQQNINQQNIGAQLPNIHNVDGQQQNFVPQKNFIPQQQNIQQQPQQQNFVPQQDLMPQQQNLVPNQPNMIQQQNVVPQQQNIVPQQQQNIPPPQNVVPQQRQNIPPPQNIVPVQQNIAPQQNIVPQQQNIAPQQNIAQQQQYIPPPQNVIPQQNIVPQQQQNIPPPQNVVPQQHNIVPQQPNIPQPQNVVPQQQIPDPKQNEQQNNPKENANQGDYQDYENHDEFQFNTQEDYQMLQDYNDYLSADFEQFFAQVVPKKDVLERVERIKPQKNSTQMNIVMFALDSMSHLSYQRKLPQTYAYLKKTLNAVILNAYNIVGDATTAAILPIFTGHTELELPEARVNKEGSHFVDIFPFIWNKFEQTGYVTMYAEDQPTLGTFQLRFNGFEEPPVDHYIRPFWQAAQSSPLHENSPQYCLGDKTEHQYTLDYMKDLFVKYPKIPKFAFGFLGELSHADNNPAEYVDKDLVEFLEYMKDNGHLDNTLVIIMGDHGARYSKVRYTTQGKLEERLPLMSLTFPKWFQEKHPQLYKNLQENVNRLTTPFDLHETLKSVIDIHHAETPVHYKDRGISMLKPVPANRTCDSAGIQLHWCTCMKYELLDTSDPKVRGVGEFIVSHINGLTEKIRDQCEPLQLTKIHDARMVFPNEQLLKYKKSIDGDNRIANFSNTIKLDILHYQITIEVAPSLGQFEATIQATVEDGSFSIIGDISRINKYGDQPHCIMKTHPDLRKYCLCKTKPTQAPVNKRSRKS